MGIGSRRAASGDLWQWQRIYEFRETIRIENGRTLRRGSKGNAGLKKEPA